MMTCAVDNEDMVALPGRRNIDDLSKSASMDMVAINNLIVSFRGLVKKARVRTINHLAKKVKQLRRKKGNEEQTKKNLEKAERLHEEIKAMNGLDVDKVAKFSLANTTSFDELVRTKPDSAMNTRAMTRLACCPDLADQVSKFRAEHDDWRELANFILYKNTGRRYRKNKTKRKDGETVIRDMVVKQKTRETKTESDSENESENEIQEAESESTNKGSSDVRDGIAARIRADASGSGGSDASGSGESDASGSGGSDASGSGESDASGSGESDASGSGDSGEDDATGDSGVVVRDKLARRLLGVTDEDPDDVRSESDDSESDNRLSESENSAQSGDRGPVVRSENKPTTIHKQIKPAAIEKGDMVVTRFNLDEQIKSDDTVVLTGGLKPHKPKSSFFLNDGSESESDRSESESDAEHDSDQIRSEKDISEEQTTRGRQIVESIFVNNLSQKSGGVNQRRVGGGYDDHRGPRQSGGHGNYGVAGSDGNRAFGRGPASGNWARGGPSNRARGGQSVRGRGGQSGRGRGGQSDRMRVHGAAGGAGEAGVTGGSDGAGGAPSDVALHPSWEASRKRKELSSIQTFTGKKMKFDDDDD